jgi:hypothetical protein
MNKEEKEKVLEKLKDSICYSNNIKEMLRKGYIIDAHNMMLGLQQKISHIYNLVGNESEDNQK